MAKNCGIEADILSSDEVQARYPLLNISDSLGGLFFQVMDKPIQQILP
jgi:hypothetical protein